MFKSIKAGLAKLFSWIKPKAVEVVEVAAEVTADYYSDKYSDELANSDLGKIGTRVLQEVVTKGSDDGGK